MVADVLDESFDDRYWWISSKVENDDDDDDDCPLPSILFLVPPVLPLKPPPRITIVSATSWTVGPKHSKIQFDANVVGGSYRRDDEGWVKSDDGDGDAAEDAVANVDDEEDAIIIVMILVLRLGWM